MKKSMASRILALLMAICLIAQPAFAADAGGSAVPAEEYTFVGIPANATIENNGWQLSIEESAPGFYFNRASTGWYDTKTDNSLLQLSKDTRNYIGYELDVKVAGNYALTIHTYATSKDYNVFVNGKEVGKMVTGGTTHEVNASVPFKKGINTIKIQAPEGGSIRLKKINLDWAGELGATTYTFASGAVNTSLHTMSFERNGFRFSNDLSYSLYAGMTDLTGNAGYARMCLNGRLGNFVGFDMMVNEAGNYDVVINAENNANHGAELRTIINGTTNRAANGTVIGNFDLSQNKTRYSANHRTVQLAGNGDFNEGYNVMQFESVGTVSGSNLLYFREGLSLVNPEAAATVEGSTMSFANGTATTVNAQVSEFGLYYLYIKGKVSADGFGGNVTAGGLTQYIDFNTAYYNQAAGTEVIRIVGPIWMNAGKDTAISFTETAAATSSLDLTAIEAHAVKQNFWTIDRANQNYDGVTIANNGWELSDKSNASQYKLMTLGAQVLSGKTETSYFNTHRDLNATNINLMNGQVMFDIYVPETGVYTLSGVFQNRLLSNNVVVASTASHIYTEVELYDAADSQAYKSSDIAVAYLEEGINTITIGLGSLPTDNSKYLYMKSLTITPYDGECADDMALAIDKVDLTEGDTAKATVTVNAVEGAFNGEYAVTYKTSDAKVATVDAEGNITAVAEGKAKISAVVTVQGKQMTKSVDITVAKKVVAVSGISLDKDAVELEIGATDTLVATVIPADATDVTVTWESSADTIATVVDGVVTAVAEGQATITAKAGDFTATCVVTVKAPAPDFMEGDINGDGRLNTRDVVALRRHIAGGYEGNVVIEAACDMNGDGRLNSRDVKALREFIAG